MSHPVATRFRDRMEAGQRLAEELTSLNGRDGLLVLGLPRGGVPVAYQVARALTAPLDVFVVRKLGLPGHEELAMGAIASGGVRVLNEPLVRELGVAEAELERVAATEGAELIRRERAYRGDRDPVKVAGRTVVLVDDGLATGSTMKAAARAVREQGAASVIVAVPVAAERTCDELRDVVDHVVCAVTPDPFYAVGLWYEDFSPTSDKEVRELLRRAGHSRADRPGPEAPRDG